MSFDVVSLIRQYLTPVIVEKIAAALGLDRSQTNSAIGALLPAILSGLLGAGQRPGGARTLNEAVGAQDQGILGNLANMIGGGGQKSLIDSGSSILGSLLGGSSANALGSAAGRFSGIGESGAKGLMGMLAPVVLGALGQQQRSNGLDASGLVNLLASQKENIAKALPAGFAKELQGTGLLDSVSSYLPDRVAKAAPSITERAPSSGGMPSILPWVAGLAALALLLWMFTSRDHATHTQVPPVGEITNVAGATQHINDLGDRLRMALGTVTDEASAKAALPRLNDIAAELGRVETAAANFPAAERSSLSAAISALIAALGPKIEAILKIPGVGDVLRPVIETVQARLRKIGGV